jgi:hypothetical protein
MFSLGSSNICLDECTRDNYHMTLSSKPLKTAAPPNTTEYFMSVYFADFEFVTVTYTGKVQ